MHDENNKSVSFKPAALPNNDVRLGLLYEIGRILASAETMNEAAPQILETVCQNLRFELGELWNLGKGEDNLHFETNWYFPSAQLEEFTADSRKFKLALNADLPGKVLAKKSSIWIERLSDKDKMPRRAILEEAGFQSAFAFPIILGEKIPGVFCFFSYELRQPDENLLEMFDAISNNIGQLIKREKSESSLRASEDRYRAFIEQSTEGIWRFELDEKFSIHLPIEEQVERAFRHGYLAECNDAMARMYGLTKANELVGSRISDLLDMNDEANSAYLRAFIESNYNLTDAESHEKDINGGDKFFLNSLVGTVEDENLIRVWGTQRDITEQKRTEQFLKNNEERYRALVEATSTVVWRSTPDGELNFVGSFWETVSGQQNEEILGSGWLNAIHPDDRERTIKVWQSAIDSKNIYETEFRVLTIDGVYRWFAVRGVPILDDENNVREWVGANTDIHERKFAEEKLRESEERYRSLFETMDEGFCLCEMIFDADGKPFDYRFLEINPVFEKMTGLVQPTGKTARELIPNLEAHWFEIYGKVITTGESLRFTDGSEAMNRWFDVYASRVGGKDSRKFTLLFTNITERKQAEMALKESQSHLALALKVGRAGTFEWDIKNNINYWSPEIEELYGVPVGTFEGNYEGWKKRVVAEDSERIDLGIQAVLEKKAKDYEYEFRAILPDNSQRWFAGRARFDYDENDEPLWMIGINLDITERKLTEIALSDARARLESTLTAGEIGTWTWNITNDSVIADKNLARMFSVTESDASGGKIENYIRAIHPNDRERVKNIISKALADGDHYEADYRLVSPKGDIYWVVARGTIERDAAGNPVNLPGVVLDITGRKEAESEREVLFIEAQKAQEIAEQANKSKDEFIALVSHELRSPLNAMLGWTRILQNQKPDEQTINYALDVIVRNARSQSKLIEDLLDIARVGEKKLRIEMQPTELVPIIHAAVEIIKPAAELKNIFIIQSLDRAASFVTGDDDRLRQVMENLLSNAVKFTPADGQIDVRLERDNERAKITINDTGQGISAEFLPQLFQRFKQADLSTTRRHGGLGIGLSLARDLVELHGGTISAASAGEGMGASFTVDLPLRLIEPINENEIEKGEIMDAQGKLSGFWILAVDDEADAREIVSFMLQINGARVTTANSAVEALEILKSSQERLPDVLLSDISMPNENGYALLEKIRSLPKENGGQIPAVALTAFNRPEDRQSAFEAGFQKHLGKPVEMDELIAAIIETAAKQ